VAELLASSSTSSRDHTVLQSLFSLSRSTPASSMRSRNSPRPLPFRATRAPQQLRQELSDLLRPLMQALIISSPGYVRSSSTPAKNAAEEHLNVDRPPRAIAGQATATSRCALVRASFPDAPMPPTSTPAPKPRSPASSPVSSSRPGTSGDNLMFPRGLIAETVTQVNSAIRTCL
jgi:hypothetical protein